MVQRLITLPDDLHNKLKAEENASGLIQNLLMQYFSVGKLYTVEEIENQIELAKSEAEIKKQEIDNTLAQAVKIWQERKTLAIKRQLEDKQKKQLKEDAQKENIKNNILANYSLPPFFSTAKVNQLVEEFYLNRTNFKGLDDFMERKGIESKPLIA